MRNAHTKNRDPRPTIKWQEFCGIFLFLAWNGLMWKWLFAFMPIFALGNNFKFWFYVHCTHANLYYGVYALRLHQSAFRLCNCNIFISHRRNANWIWMTLIVSQIRFGRDRPKLRTFFNSLKSSSTIKSTVSNYEIALVKKGRGGPSLLLLLCWRFYTDASVAYARWRRKCVRMFTRASLPASGWIDAGNVFLL